jgi:signal transduction histidine kinase
MSSKTRSHFLKSLKGRLLLRYSLLFGLLALATFASIDRQIDNHLTLKANAELRKFLHFFSVVKYTKGKVDFPEWFMEKTSNILMASSKGGGPSMFALYGPSGKMFYNSNGMDFEFSFEDYLAKAGSMKEPHFQNVKLHGGKSYRMMQAQFKGEFVLMAAMSRESDEEQLAYYRQLFIIGGGLLFLGGLGIAWLTLSQATSGLNRVRQAAGEITVNGDYSQEISLKNEGTEVDGLILSFNRLLEHTDVLIEELEEVSNNVAHDLRTPITRMKTLAQTTLLKKNESLSLEDFAAQVLEECELQSGIIETVLAIAGLESGSSILDCSEFSLSETIEGLYHLYKAVAENKGIELKFTVPEKAVLYNGDRRKIERALANIIDNALKYTEAGGEVGISLRVGEDLRIEIQDTGVGIGSDDCEKVFKRFYRCDSSRSKAGNGLGLSMADSVIRAHKGTIGVNSTLGEGSCFSVLLK